MPAPKRFGHSWYCTEELWNQILVVAKSEERSAAWVILKAVEEYVARKIAAIAEKDGRNV